MKIADIDSEKLSENSEGTPFLGFLHMIDEAYPIVESHVRIKRQLIQDKKFIQQIKENVGIEEDSGKVMEEEKSNELDMAEGMLMAGLSMFENNF